MISSQLNVSVSPATRQQAWNTGDGTVAGDFPASERRRRGAFRIPDDPGFVLSEAQSGALPGIRYAGWDICFLRERPFQNPEIVIHNREDGRFGILDIDGRIRTPGELKVRKQGTPDPAPERRQVHDLAYITV